MFPLWDVAIAPVLDAARAKRVVEIGALRGETTVLMLDRLGSDAELHVIDPLPEFDPAEHEQRFPGRYIFHRDTSHNVLPDLGPMDAALIDGDHNWYTVDRELALLAQSARAAGAPLPVLILHDVGWPYGRRDLYYDPDRVPEEFRQPYRQGGMRPDRRELLPNGGLNPTMYNAVVEGGARNGVMTALDDFIAAHDRPVRLVFLPVYFGLAIVVEQARLDANDELVAALDRLESSDGRYDLMKVTEETRLQAMIFQHNVYYPGLTKLARATARYLTVVKSALLNEYDREDEAMSRQRLDHLEHCLDVVRDEGIRGDVAECGIGRGGGAIFLRAYLDAHEVPGRKVWVADTFRAPPLDQMRDAFSRFGLLDDRVQFLEGSLDATLADAPVERLALLHLAHLSPSEIRTALDHLYQKLVPGGFVIVGDGQESAAAKEIAAFRAERGVTARLDRVDGGAICWRKG